MLILHEKFHWLGFDRCINIQTAKVFTVWYPFGSLFSYHPHSWYICFDVSREQTRSAEK